MEAEYIINACSGICIEALPGQEIAVIDLEGGQVVDFFAENAENREEFLSTGVTIDCNESLRLKVGDGIYSNLYRKMFEILYDEVGEHDLLHPCCCPEMYDFFYQNGKDHPNCLDNINHSLGEARLIIQPVNLFMHTKLYSDGRISVEPPVSKPGDQIILRADMHMRFCTLSGNTHWRAAKPRNISSRGDRRFR